MEGGSRGDVFWGVYFLNLAFFSALSLYNSQILHTATRLQAGEEGAKVAQEEEEAV